MSFCDCLLWLSLMASRLMHVVGCVRSSFLRLDRTPLCGHPMLGYPFTVDAHLGCGQPWAVVNYSEHGCTDMCSGPCFHFFCVCTPHGIAESCDHSIFNFLRKPISSCTFSHSHPQCTRVLLSPHPPQHLTVFSFGGLGVCSFFNFSHSEVVSHCGVFVLFFGFY